MLNDKIRAVIFDLDGVLTDTAQLHFQAWKRLLEDEGIFLPDSYCDKLRGIGRRESLNLLIDHFNINVDNTTFNQMTEKKNSYYKELIKDLNENHLLPGANERLEELRYLNTKIGLASSSKNALFLLKRLNIEKYFDVITNPEHIFHAKPAPDIYLNTARRLHESPCACIGIEDAYVGIESIKHAHMWAMGIGDQSSLLGADWVFKDLSEFSFLDTQWSSSCSDFKSFAGT